MDNKDKKTTENPSDKRDEFYKKLKESLDNTATFPADYLFKFIVPTNHTALNSEKEDLQKQKDAITNDLEAIKELDDKIAVVSEKIKKEDAKLAKVDAIFKDNKDANIQTKKSKSGKYTSKTIKVKMDSSDDVINRYKDAEGIDGIISL
jgi:putative lipoic acid-binding regulatory protein